MKRPNNEDQHYISWREYADHLDQEIERLKAELKAQSDGRESEVNARNIIIKSLEKEKQKLKAERVELVKFCMKVKKNWTIVTDLKAIEIIAQFNKEKS